MEEVGRAWYEHLENYAYRLSGQFSISFAFVATHNHFVLERGKKLFKQSAPVIKLPDGAGENEHLELLGILNSSTACFWLKQMSQAKGGLTIRAAVVIGGRLRRGSTVTSSPVLSCKSSPYRKSFRFTLVAFSTRWLRGLQRSSRRPCAPRAYRSGMRSMKLGLATIAFANA